MIKRCLSAILFSAGVAILIGAPAFGQGYELSCVAKTPTPGSDNLCSVFLRASAIAVGQFTLKGSAIATWSKFTFRPGVNGAAANKQVFCSPLTLPPVPPATVGARADHITCVIAGLNTTDIQPTKPANANPNDYWSGTMAELVVTLGTAPTPSQIAIDAGAAAAQDGSVVSVSVIGQPQTFNGGDGATPPPPPPPPIGVTRVACLPATVLAPGNSICTVLLSTAVTAATPVIVSSANPIVTVPASMLVPAGATSGTFTATIPAAVTADTTVAIAAMLNQVSRNFSLTITAPNTKCDLDKDGKVDVTDFNLAIAAAVAGTQNIGYVQKVGLAALGQACTL